MVFTVPSAILLAALALPIIAFYILKVRMRRIPVSTNLFWKQIFEEKPPRSIWQNFRHLLSLLMQLLLLGSLVLAFADPYLPWQVLQARRLVLVVDPSASMQATDVEPSRFEAAMQDAKSIVEGLRYRDEMAIVVAGESPDVIMGMTSHTPTLIRAIQGLRVTDNPTVLEPAIELGKQLIGDHPHGQVVVLTDGCDTHRSPGTETAKLTSMRGKAENEQALAEIEGRVLDTQYRVFATEAAANIGIHQFQVRRSLIDPLGYEVLIGVFNASDIAVKCRLELSLDEAIVDIIPLDLKANEKWSRSVEKTSIQGGELHAQLTKFTSGQEAAKAPDKVPANQPSALVERSNMLARDDDAWAILPERQTQRVLIVSPGNLFLTKVFEANPLVEVSVAKEIPAEWPRDHLIVLHQVVPTSIPTGNVFVVDPISDCELWSVGSAIENPIVTEIDKTSALMHHVRLDNVVMPKASQIQFKNKAKTLAGTIDKFPVYAELTKENGKCLILSVNLEESDIAFRTVFPIIVSNALGWFAGTAGELTEAQKTGAAMEARIVAPKVDGAETSLVSPSGGHRTLTVPLRSDEGKGESDHRINTGPMAESGVWRIVRAKESAPNRSQAIEESPGTEVLSAIAVNLADPSETDLRPAPKLLEGSQASLLASGWLSRPLWFYLVALACTLFAVEWFLYQRRIIT
jgi:hypothetical protein